jgi:DNA ligase-1
MTTQILPQLAVDIDPDCATARFPLWGFVKVDGARGCRVTGTFTGRSLKPLGNLGLIEKFGGPAYEGFDGELTINGYLRDCEIPAELSAPDKPGDAPKTLCGLSTGILAKKKIEKGETEFPTNLVWNLFDYLHPTVIGLSYQERYEALQYVASGLPDVHVLPYAVINNPEEAQAFIDKCLLEGYEGAIFRDPTARHKHGRATAKGNDFWRFKPASRKDCIITGFEEAMQNNNEAKTNALGRTERSTAKAGLVGKGMIGTFLATDVATGEPIRLGPGSATHQQRIDWFNDPTQICGWPAEYVSLDTGVKDAPRQARFFRRREKNDQAVEAA